MVFDSVAFGMGVEVVVVVVDVVVLDVVGREFDCAVSDVRVVLRLLSLAFSWLSFASSSFRAVCTSGSTAVRVYILYPGESVVHTQLGSYGISAARAVKSCTNCTSGL